MGTSLVAGRITRTRQPRTLSVNVTVSAVVVDGVVSEQDFIQWLDEAVGRYHTFRAGNVGLDIVGGIKRPNITGG